MIMSEGKRNKNSLDCENCKNVRKLENEIKELKDNLNEIKSSYKLLELQSICIQGSCSSYAISDYILRSRELANTNGKNNKSELHIITNELQQYDFTAISSLAIAVNIMNETKYIYYLPKDSIMDFAKLKSQVKCFIKREMVAMKLIDSWLRARISKNHNIEGFIRDQLDGEDLDVILEKYTYLSVDEKLLVEELYRSFTNKKHRIEINEDVYNWLHGMENTISVDSFLDTIEKIITCVNVSEEISELCEMFTLMVNLNNFSKWLIDNLELSVSEITKLLNILMNEVEIPGVYQIRKWIIDENQNFSGVSSLDEDEISDMIDRNLISISICNEQILKPCYSFCLYLGDKYNDVSVAWYSCHDDSDIKSKGVPDNQITVHTNTLNSAFSKREISLFIDAYERIIKNHDDAKNTLNNHSCDLIKRCLNARCENGKTIL